MLIIGNIDPIVTIENIVQSSEYIEKCNVKVISGAQHFPHQQKPDIVNEAILKFFMGKQFNKYLYILYYIITRCILGTTTHIEKASSKNIMSSWLEPFSKTVKYGNHMFDAVHKKTNDVVSVLPSKILYLGQTTN